MSELISIIIPTYNRAFLIKDTIESIRVQTYSNWECLIIDGNSSDCSEDIIPSYFKFDERFQYIRIVNSQKEGPNYLRNYGFQIAKGEFVYFFDSDDILKPNALSTYLSKFTYNIDAVIARIEKIDLVSGKLLGENTIKSNNLIIDYFKGYVSFYVCGPLWRKSFLDKQEILFDEKIKNLDDFDFNLRMIYTNPNLIFLDEALVKYNQHQHSLKKEVMKLNREEINSAFFARNKHLKLLKEKNNHQLKEIEEIVIEHRKEILRRALISSNVIYIEMFNSIIGYYLKNLKVSKFFKITIGLVLFKIFKKGYFLLK